MESKEYRDSASHVQQLLLRMEKLNLEKDRIDQELHPLNLELQETLRRMGVKKTVKPIKPTETN